MDLYAENILDHYRHPRHKETLEGADVSHEEINVSCGDKVTVSLKLTDGTIADIGWQGEGCAISQAGISILTDELIGLSVDEVMKMKKQTVYELLGVPIGPRRFKCALLCLHAVKNAIHKLRDEAPQSWLDTVEID